MVIRLAVLALVVALAAPARAERSREFDGATTALLVGIPAALLVWDGVLAVRNARTESQLLRDAAWQVSAIPYALGFVCGHWFLNRTEPTSAATFWMGFATIGAVVVLDVALRSDDRPAWRYPGAWLGLGIAAGALTWAQRW